MTRKIATPAEASRLRQKVDNAAYEARKAKRLARGKVKVERKAQSIWTVG